MKYLFLIISISVIFVIIISVFFKKRENFSQDIKTKGQNLIDTSKKSLTGYYTSIKNISTISDSNFQTSFSKFVTPQNLENSIKGISKTLNCEDGNFMIPDFSYTSTCTTCQPSFFCVNAQKYKCPLNTWSNAGATGCLGLDKCPSGFMCTNKIQENCPTGYFCATGVSNICPKGSYCTNGNNIICPTGTYNEFTGKILLSDCLRCSTGYYCIYGNRIICPTGSYCSNGNRNVCPSGSYNNTTGNTGINSCMICPAGSFCFDGINEICGISTWSDTGASYCQYRQTVPPGYHYDESYFGDYKNDKKHIKIPCDPGYYCRDGLRRECATGTWSDALESSSSCKPMIDCPEGNSCGTKKKVKCATGTWSDPGSTACSDLSKCPAGSICANLVRRQCATGTWSDSGATTCLDVSKCPTGYYINYTNSTGKFTGGVKVLCEEGFKCSNGIRTMCPTGQFSYAGSSSCMLCPPGSSCKNGIKILCGTGTYSDSPGSIECKYCPIIAKTGNGPNGEPILTRNLNVKTLNSANAEVFQGASQCILAKNNDRCSTTSQCGIGYKGNPMSCCYWDGMTGATNYSPGYRCADFDTWTDWTLYKGGYWSNCMTGPQAETRYPYLLSPGEYNFSTNTIGT